MELSVFGGPGNDYGEDCVWTASNRVLITGQFEQTVDFVSSAWSAAFAGKRVLDAQPARAPYRLTTRLRRSTTPNALKM